MVKEKPSRWTRVSSAVWKRTSIAQSASTRVLAASARRPSTLLLSAGAVCNHTTFPAVNAENLGPIIEAQIHGASYVYTDEGAASKKLGRMFKRHDSVNHSAGEYVRGNVHTNTIEGYFSIMKRGINGVYHHVSQQHLKRYLAEFDFRYNERERLGVNDAARMAKSVKGIIGKRLTYR